MAGSFGGSVKLTGESEYRKALSQITQSLRVVSSEMKSVSSAYGTNDADTKALANQSKQLSNALNQQKTALQNLKSQLSSMESEYKKTQTSHKALVSQYEQEKAKLAEIGKTLGTSSAEYKAQQKVVANLEAEVQKSSKTLDTQTKAINNMRIQTANAETTVNNTAKAIDKLGTETEDTSKALQKAGDGFTVFKGVVADLASSAIQKAIEGVKKLGTAIVDVGKQAVSSYADYQQLVGGVETLFKDSAGVVQDYANNAYKTAGLSANAYMETVTSFSASLLQGLGGDTAKAAKIADMAIIDMSDNANKMGTSMEMIQNAYQGFAKDNFTMLDNLKLGYGGTASEMARLINETGVMGKSFKATAQNVKDVPFDKMIEAIHQVQVNMGITGTTAMEASETISGSVNSMKSAWQNLLTGIADSQVDKRKLVKNFTDTVKTTAKNVIPTVKETIKGLVDVAEDLLNTLMGPGTFKFDGEAFVKGVEDAIKKVIEVFKWFVDNRDLVIAAINGIIAAFVAAKVATFVTSVISAVNALKTMVTATQGVNTAMQILNGTMAMNPFALIAGLVVGLGTALLTFASNTEKAEGAHSKFLKEMEKTSSVIDDNKNAWEDLNKTRQETVDKGLSEMSYYERLADELDEITDKNGKVKDGYEQRASFITSELSKVLGIEINLQDGVVQGYKKIQESIDKTIEKKRAEIILNSQEAGYTEAIQKRAEALSTQADLEELLMSKRSQANALEQYIREAEADRDWQRRAELMRKQQDLLAEAASVEENYNKQKALTQEYAFAIGQYETNMALFHEGKYNEMQNVNWQYVENLGSVEDAKKALLDKDISNEEEWIKTLQSMRNDSNKEMIDKQIKAAQKTIEEKKKERQQYVSVTQEGLNQVENAWDKSLDNQVSAITGANVEFRDAGKGNVQMFVDGVASGEPKSKAEMEQLVRRSIDEIKNKSGDANSAGQNLVAGVNNGIANQNQQNFAFRTISNFGASLLNRLKASLQEKSPSRATKEMGEFLLEGLSIGVEKEEDGVLSQMQDLGRNMLGTLNSELANGVSGDVISGIQDALPSQFSINTVLRGSRMASEPQSDNNGIVEAFKKALSQMTVEMDDQEMGRFVDKTVTRLVYN